MRSAGKKWFGGRIDVPFDFYGSLIVRGGSRNSLKGGGGSGPEFFEGGGGGVRVQVRGNFHILTSKKTPKNNL